MTSDEQDICVPEDFLAHLIHDLKAPVVTIGGFARRLLDGKMGGVTPEQKEGLKHTRMASKALDLVRHGHPRNCEVEKTSG